MPADAHEDYRERGPFVLFDGAVHLVCPLAGGEYTLCGSACDAATSEGMPELRWRKTRSRTVTCAECADVIRACRGVRVAEE